MPGQIVDAIEAFVQAKITYERRYAAGERTFTGAVDVDETREHLRDKLAELVK